VDFTEQEIDDLVLSLECSINEAIICLKRDGLYEKQSDNNKVARRIDRWRDLREKLQHMQSTKRLA
jgi:hypothetical protein